MSKKRSDIDFVAMAIVNHVCETHGISVTERQKHNDELMDYAYGKMLGLEYRIIRDNIAFDQNVDLSEREKMEPVVVEFDGFDEDAEAYCGNCDEDLSEGDDHWKYCPRCGTKLLWPGDVPPPDHTTKSYVLDFDEGGIPPRGKR